MKKIWTENNELIIDLELQPHPELPSQYAVGKRHKYLHPHAIIPEEVAGHISDCFRYGKESYEARLRKGHKVSVARPGFSGHNWGISIDLDLKAIKKKWGISGWEAFIKELRHYMAGWGWSWITNEEWHFNYVGVKEDWLNIYIDYAEDDHRIDKAPYWDIDIFKAQDLMPHHPWKTVRDRVKELYGNDLNLSKKEIQGALKRAAKIFDDPKLDPGPVDGIVGPKTQMAINRFLLTLNLSPNSLWKWSLISVVAVPNKEVLEATNG